MLLILKVLAITYITTAVPHSQIETKVSSHGSSWEIIHSSTKEVRIPTTKIMKTFMFWWKKEICPFFSIIVFFHKGVKGIKKHVAWILVLSRIYVFDRGYNTQNKTYPNNLEISAPSLSKQMAQRPHLTPFLISLKIQYSIMMY